MKMVKEGDIVRFKHFVVPQVGSQFGGKLALVLKVNSKLCKWDEDFNLEFIEVDVLVDGQIEREGINFFEKVEDV
jgi:hypothetical protein